MSSEVKSEARGRILVDFWYIHNFEISLYVNFDSQWLQHRMFLTNYVNLLYNPLRPNVSYMNMNIRIYAFYTPRVFKLVKYGCDSKKLTQKVCQKEFFCHRQDRMMIVQCSKKLKNP